MIGLVSHFGCLCLNSLLILGGKIINCEGKRTKKKEIVSCIDSIDLKKSMEL